jgi:hypothetical protein
LTGHEAIGRDEPHFIKRNAWEAEIPFLQAQKDTVIPGTLDSPTARIFSSGFQLRRRSTIVITLISSSPEALEVIAPSIRLSPNGQPDVRPKEWLQH